MGKKKAVQDLFDDIAPTYDRLNHLLSFNVDKRWRKLAIRKIEKPEKILLLDVACGTGDFAIAAAKAGVKRIVGIDIARNMIAVGKRKIEKLHLDEQIDLREGDSEKMEFENDMFDAVTVAFGVRNFENLKQGLAEMYRVLKPGGQVIILEFSKPVFTPIKQLYFFYFRRILPFVGGLLSGNKSAYIYLPESVLKFPQGEAFLKIMQECGFRTMVCRHLTFGIASLYTAEK